MTGQTAIPPDGLRDELLIISAIQIGLLYLLPFNQSIDQLEAKDVLPNINPTQAAERPEKCRFLSLVTLTFDL